MVSFQVDPKYIKKLLSEPWSTDTVQPEIDGIVNVEQHIGYSPKYNFVDSIVDRLRSSHYLIHTHWGSGQYEDQTN